MPVDLSGSLSQRIQMAIQRAELAVQEDSLRAAAARYLEAAELYDKYALYSISRQGQDSERARAEACRRRARTLLDTAAARERQGSGGLLSRTRRNGDRPSGGEEDLLDTNALRNQILSLIRTSSVGWKEIGGLAETKERIQAGVGLMTARAPAGVKLPRSRMLLLEGPPGTGKTLLAAAVAGELEATFFDVKASQLMSRYFGDSPRLVSLLFEEARRHAPSVIFLDEFEALAAARTGDESGVERRVLSTLLAELDGVGGKSEESPVLTMAATNTPDRLDPAILSRFATQIRVPLPDEQARGDIWRIHLEDAGYSSKVDRKTLVQRTAGFSGRDIRQVCVLAIESMLLRVNPGLVDLAAKATRKPGDASPAIRGRKAAPAELKIEPLAPEDFEKAFNRLRPTGSGGAAGKASGQEEV